MNGTDIRFRPQLETLDGRALPGALAGGVFASGGYAGTVAVGEVSRAGGAAGGIGDREGGGQSHQVSPAGGMAGGVLRGNTPSASRARSAGEEIPQTT